MSHGIELASDVDEEAVVEELVDDTGAWRFAAFRAMGFDVGMAMVLAQDRSVDWHKVKAAVDGGCSLELAREIFT